MSIHSSLIAVAKEVANPIKTAENPHFRSKFAPLCDMATYLRPVLAKHGLVVVQTTDVGEYGPCLITTIYAEDGSNVSGKYPLEPVKKDPQGYAGAMTFARRYALMAILGIAGDDDDDGELAAKEASRKSGKVDKITNETRTAAVKRTADQITALGTIRSEMLKFAGPNHAKVAEEEYKAAWKEWAYTENFDAFHAAMCVVKNKYYAIAVNEQRA